MQMGHIHTDLGHIHIKMGHIPIQMGLNPKVEDNRLLRGNVSSIGLRGIKPVRLRGRLEK